MAITIKGVYLNSSNEAVSSPVKEDKTPDTENLKERHPPKISKTIANCRYAFDNDPTVRGIILNNITTANNKYKIVSDDETAKNHIEQKAIEWDLDNLMTQTLLKCMRDGPCFIEKAIVNNTIQVRFLAYDEDKYKFKIIRDPQSDEIIGFKQKFKTTKNAKDWEKTKYDELNNEEKDEEANFQPSQIIYPVLLEEGGKAKSLIMPILDYIDDKWTLEGFMLSVAHKAGNLIGLTIGNDKVSNSKVPKNFINKLITTFRSPVNKDVAVIPDGVKADVIGNNQLSDLPSYLKYFRGEIFIALQTPEALFSSVSSNRSALDVQADDKVGYEVFIGFLRFFLKKYFERELIDDELKLKKMKGIGTTKIEFNVDDPVEPLNPNSKDAEQVAEDAQIEEDQGTIPKGQGTKPEDQNNSDNSKNNKTPKFPDNQNIQ